MSRHNAAIDWMTLRFVCDVWTSRAARSLAPGLAFRPDPRDVHAGPALHGVASASTS
jgi:hypothetical protein